MDKQQINISESPLEKEGDLLPENVESKSEENKPAFIPEDFLAAIEEMSNERLKMFGLVPDDSGDLPKAPLKEEDYFAEIKAVGVTSFICDIKRALAAAGYEFVDGNTIKNVKSGQTIFF